MLPGEPNMDHMERMILRMKQLQPQIPFWAKAEQMEICTSQAELWKYADEPKKKIRIHTPETLAKFKRERVEE